MGTMPSALNVSNKSMHYHHFPFKKVSLNELPFALILFDKTIWDDLIFNLMGELPCLSKCWVLDFCGKWEELEIQEGTQDGGHQYC